jgi:MFS transporter, PPP family, 3-phenylpropionic acid transporter
MTIQTTHQDARAVQRQGGAFYFTFYAALGVYLPFLNVYFKGLGLSGWEIGILASLAPAVTLLTSAPLTILADRRHWRVRMLAIGTAALVCSLIAFTFPIGFWGLFAAMIFYAICFSPLTPLADTLAAGMTARRGLNFGDLRLWGSLGFAALSILAGGIWQRTGYRPMFLAGGAIYLLSIWFGARLENHRQPVLRKRPSLRMVTTDTFVPVVMVTTFLAMAAYGMDSTFSGIYITHLGGTGLFVGLLFGLSALFELPAMRYTGHLLRRLGGPRTLLVAYVLYAITYGGFALARSPDVVLALCTLRGLAFGLFYAATVRLINERTPPEWAATMQGVMNGISFGLARLVSGPISGRVFDVFGPAAVYVLCFALTVTATIIMGITATTTVGATLSTDFVAERHTRMA